ncbi:MAG: poly-gamma-glutamate hydrolase family protein, partial [Bauldia sp.]
MDDRYADFAALAAAERRGRDYDIVVREVAGSPVAIVAPHAGDIEPGTSEIAVTIAGGDCNLYLFEGHGPDAYRLHVMSSHFDEPECLALVTRCAVVVTV